MKLSEHFSLSEFERSATATKLGIDNSVPSQYIPALEQLCKEILEPLREFTGQPILISSGYRCPALNKAVGGVKNSQHMTGEAADIHIPVYDFKASDGTHHSNMETLNKWMCWLIDNTDFDQCIKETANRKNYWIHISCKRDRSKNRHHVIHFMQKK